MDQNSPQTVLVNGRSHVVPDLSHHLSDLAKRRKPSPLKQLAKYLTSPDMLMLAGGMPNPEYFPFDTLSAKTLASDALLSGTVDAIKHADQSSSMGWLWNLLGLGQAGSKLEHVSVPKYGPNREANQLAISLQYGTAQGIAPLKKFIDEFTHKVLKPYLATTTTTITTGNTDGWNRVVEALLNDGDAFLVEEWCYPSALVTARPHGAFPVPVAMDVEGMRADSLQVVLKGWDAQLRGRARPHLMYMVPIGQNPSGATMSAQRKKEIYEICVEFDVIIVEDDPYYFLQEGPYTPAAYRQTSPIQSADDWVDTLSPSFLKFDYEGRVIRLDTFSKTIAPGSRLGWVTATPLFAEAVLRVGEVSTQAPCGFGQSMVTELLQNHWGQAKYIQWLQGIQKVYTERRDQLVDALVSEFDVSEENAEMRFLSGAKVFAAREKRFRKAHAALGDEKPTEPWLTFIPPTSGMFVWVRVHLLNHPGYLHQSPDDPMTLEERLWTQIAEKKLLVGPGWLFTTRLEDEVTMDANRFPDQSFLHELLQSKKQNVNPSGDPSDHDPSQYAHFRIAFSTVSADDMRKAVKIFAQVLRAFFNE